MLKKALKVSLIISILGIGILVGALFLTKSVKKEVEKAEKAIPDRVEYLNPKVISEVKMAEKVHKKMKKKADIYSKSYQKAAKAVIDKLKKENKYTLEAPLLVVNPFGTNKTGLYIYFRHNFRVNTRYTVSVKSLDTENEIRIPDFSASMYTNTSNMPLAEQEGQLIGLIAGVKNYVSIYLYDDKETMVAKAGYKIELPADGESSILKLNTEHNREISQLSSGLFAVFGINSAASSESLPFYDNNGILRARLSMKKGGRAQDVNLKFIDGKIFYAIDERRYALSNPIGRVEKIYELGKGYQSYGDFDFTPANRYMLTFTNHKKKKNRIISVIDLYDGRSWELIDFDKLLKGERQGLEFSSLRIINDNDILVAEKNTSTVFRINNVFRRPEIKAVFSSDESLMEGKTGEVFYKKEGDFSSHMQPLAVYTDRMEKPVNRTYHIYLLNQTKAGGNTSYYDYLIDENTKSYKLTKSINLPSLSENGGISKVRDNMILSLGDRGLFYEYNKENNLLSTYKSEQAFYKAMKFDMKGSWFSE